MSGECLASSAWAWAWARAWPSALACSRVLEGFSCAGFGVIREVFGVLRKKEDAVLACFLQGTSDRRWGGLYRTWEDGGGIRNRDVPFKM